ncbi:hypothetical protein CSPX01_06597 [Colletotrichum filicis]|nr:hypothetical protein CSPX01_06597 [Colletotrichum filicis]
MGVLFTFGLTLASNCLLCFCFLGDSESMPSCQTWLLQSIHTLPSGTEEVQKNLSRDYALQKRPLADSCVKNTPVSSLFSQAQAISLFLLYTYSSGLVILQVTPRKRPVGSCSELEWPCPGWRVPALLAAGGPVGISPIPFPPLLLAPLLPFDRKRNGPRSQLLVGETMPPSPCRGDENHQ